MTFLGLFIQNATAAKRKWTTKKFGMRGKPCWLF